MNQTDSGVLLFCACVTLPFLAGIAATLLTQRRLRRFGWRGLIPFYNLIKSYIESRHE